MFHSLNDTLTFIAGAGMIGITWYTSHLIRAVRKNSFSARVSNTYSGRMGGGFPAA